MNVDDSPTSAAFGARLSGGFADAKTAWLVGVLRIVSGLGKGNEEFSDELGEWRGGNLKQNGSVLVRTFRRRKRCPRVHQGVTDNGATRVRSGILGCADCLPVIAEYATDPGGASRSQVWVICTMEFFLAYLKLDDARIWPA
jgi:hypothetical protein